MQSIADGRRKELAARPKPVRTRKTRIPASIQELSSETSTSGKRVVVDGVIFEFEPGGAKLIRIGGKSAVLTTTGRMRWLI
jgi:hypothetical protein